MTRLDTLGALARQPAAEVFFARMVDVTATSTRYQREDNGHLGGPIGYQRLAAGQAVATTNDGGEGAGDHSHDRPAPPPAGTRCMVVIVPSATAGREAGMAFPEIIS
jgi:hypothetical protein